MQETTEDANMNKDPTNRPLTDRELAQLLQAHADGLVDGDQAREETLLEVLQLVVRETPNVEQRIGTTGSRGRVSFGRGREQVHGTALFVPDYVVGVSEIAGEDDANSGGS